MLLLLFQQPRHASGHSTGFSGQICRRPNLKTTFTDKFRTYPLSDPVQLEQIRIRIDASICESTQGDLRAQKLEKNGD